jgi:hypothetical protein
MTEVMTKPKFLAIVRLERACWEALLAEVDARQATVPGVAGAWSVKDLVAHVTAYERGLVEWLEAASCGESLVLPVLDHPDVDSRNAVIYAENRDRSWHDVLLESTRVFQQLLQCVEALPEKDLVDPLRTAWFVEPRWHESRPLWKCIADDSYQHYDQHLPDFRAWGGNS